MKLIHTLFVAALACAASSAVIATPTLSPVAYFDGSKNEYPESIAVDKRGNLYLSLTFACRIKKVTPEGVTSEFATLADDWIQGLVFDHRGNLYCTGGRGIWKITPEGASTLFAEVPGRLYLNDITIDPFGNLYATDDFKIWKIKPDGSASVWVADPLFEPGTSSFPYAVGCNGLVLSHDLRTMYVSNTSAARVLAVEVLPGGKAGRVRVVAENPALVGADGLEMDAWGNVLVAVNYEDGIVRVTPWGAVTVLAAGDILSSPTSITFGRGRNHHTLYICNSGDIFFSSEPIGEGLLKLDCRPHR